MNVHVIFVTSEGVDESVLAVGERELAEKMPDDPILVGAV